ncbi:MAG: DNA-binding protein [Erythrobacter sp.]|nr:DNA-binding protein [Erythrobacter sp.]
MSTALIGKRLKALRDERGIDQDAVAEMLGLKSRQIVSNIETGERKVKADELLTLVEKLRVDMDYFTDPYRIVGEGAFSWRQTGRTVAELKAYEAMAGSWIAMFRHEAPRVGRHALLRRPKLPLTKQSSYEDAMAEGERVAEELALGDVPAARLPEAMERDFGILVLMVDAVEGVSGAACRLPELDAVLVNRNEVAGRRHFDLAHELFHIMTWDEMPPDYSEDAIGFGRKRNRVEQLADNFAAALLMPAQVIKRFGQWTAMGAQELTARVNAVADELLVTAQALKWRLLVLGLLTKAIVLCIADDLLRNNGRDRGEGEAPPPFSHAFMDVIGKAIDRGFVSRRRAARQLGIEVYELGDVFRAHQLSVPESL